MEAIQRHRRRLKKLNEYEDYDIWYQDEVHFYRSSTICRMWAKRGQQPQVQSAPTQEKVAFSGFVNPTSGELLINECDHFNYETIMKSVEAFHSNLQCDKKILIVLDNASWHKKAVRLMREESKFENMEFLFLPPYSPEFNPIERVWRITRRERIHNHFFEKLHVLKAVFLKYFEGFKNPNAKLRTLCS